MKPSSRREDALTLIALLAITALAAGLGSIEVSALIVPALALASALSILLGLKLYEAMLTGFWSPNSPFVLGWSMLLRLAKLGYLLPAAFGLSSLVSRLPEYAASGSEDRAELFPLVALIGPYFIWLTAVVVGIYWLIQLAVTSLHSVLEGDKIEATAAAEPSTPTEVEVRSR